MASRREPTRGEVNIALDVSPDTVDAGAGLLLQARVLYSPSFELTGPSLLVKDGAGAELGVLKLTELDDEENAVGKLALKAPIKTGNYVWSALSPSFVKDGVSYDEVSTPILFAVKPHATRVLAWDAPATVVAGDRFKINIGIKCSSECAFADKAFQIYDHKGVAVAKGVLSNELWPGTTGLYFTTLELEAPSEAGLYEWSVKSSGKDLETPHAEGGAQFSLRVVDPPDCVLTVIAVDKPSQEPLAEARIALHPYKAVTDERGRAAISVTKGAYTLFVAKSKYLTVGLPVDVTTDMTMRAELDVEPPYERN